MLGETIKKVQMICLFVAFFGVYILLSAEKQGVTKSENGFTNEDNSIPNV